MSEVTVCDISFGVHAFNCLSYRTVIASLVTSYCSSTIEFTLHAKSTFEKFVSIGSNCSHSLFYFECAFVKVRPWEVSVRLNGTSITGKVVHLLRAGSTLLS